jgi:hypothetical protein
MSYAIFVLLSFMTISMVSAEDDLGVNATDSIYGDYAPKSKEGTRPPTSFIVVVALVALLGIGSTFWIRYQSKFGLQEQQANEALDDLDNATLPDMELEELPDSMNHPDTTVAESSQQRPT